MSAMLRLKILKMFKLSILSNLIVFSAEYMPEGVNDGSELSVLFCAKIINYATIAHRGTSKEIFKSCSLFTLINWKKFDFLMAPIGLFIKRPTIEYAGNPRSEFCGIFKKR